MPAQGTTPHGAVADAALILSCEFIFLAAQSIGEATHVFIGAPHGRLYPQPTSELSARLEYICPTGLVIPLK